MKDLEILGDFGNCYVYFLHYSHAMPSNDNKEWVSSTLKKNGDNHELEDECVSKDHHGVTDFVMIGYFRLC